jgi:CBS domain-containing protein
MSFKIRDYMRKDIVTADDGVSALEASKLMAEKGIGYLIVLKKAQPVGIVTERDIVHKVIAKEKAPSKVKVSECMSSPLITIDPDASIEDAVNTMVKNGVRRLPVVKGTIIYGIFTSRDLAKHFNEYEDSLTRDIIKGCAGLPF